MDVDGLISVGNGQVLEQQTVLFGRRRPISETDARKEKTGATSILQYFAKPYFGSIRTIPAAPCSPEVPAPGRGRGRRARSSAAKLQALDELERPAEIRDAQMADAALRTVQKAE